VQPSWEAQFLNDDQTGPPGDPYRASIESKLNAGLSA
jgi:hypothetical protein